MLEEPLLKSSTVTFKAGGAPVHGELVVPVQAAGIVVFAQAAGCRQDWRNRRLAQAFHHEHLATFLVDLLSPGEEAEDALSGSCRFDVPLLTRRLLEASDWLVRHGHAGHIPMGYFGVDSGTAACLLAAVRRPETILGVVSRDGRPDLVYDMLHAVRVPTLLIAAENNAANLTHNQKAFALLGSARKQLEIIPGAVPLFEDDRSMETITRLASGWFLEIFGAPPSRRLSSAPAPEARRPETRPLRVERYRFGAMTIDGKTYNKDLILFPGRVEPEWWRKTGHLLEASDLDMVFREKPEALVIGTGYSGRMKVSSGTQVALKEKVKTVIIEKTGKAGVIFNQLAEQGKNVAGAFHLTC